MRTLCNCLSLLFDAAGSELRLEGRPAARFTLLSGDEFYSTENSEEPAWFFAVFGGIEESQSKGHGTR